MTKCGYIALLGRPNAGKSTLLNALVGTKIAGVSLKPQTTRNRILGIMTESETQMLFLDTPGIHKAEGLPFMNRAMNKAAWSVISDSNLVCYLVDVCQGWKEDDARYFSGILSKAHCPVMVLATKTDKLIMDLVQESLRGIEGGIKDVVQALASEGVDCTKLLSSKPRAISAKRPEEVKDLRAVIASFMPESPFLFDADAVTDRPQRFVCAEIIREQIFRQLGEELPYSCAVKIEKFEEENAQRTRISAVIAVQKTSHKPIVIGRKGSKLKAIGTEARLNLEQHLGKKVRLDLFVKVMERWVDDPGLVAEYAALELD